MTEIVFPIRYARARAPYARKLFSIFFFHFGKCLNALKEINGLEVALFATLAIIGTSGHNHTLAKNLARHIARDVSGE